MAAESKFAIIGVHEAGAADVAEDARSAVIRSAEALGLRFCDCGCGGAEYVEAYLPRFYSLLKR